MTCLKWSRQLPKNSRKYSDNSNLCNFHGSEKAALTGGLFHFTVNDLLDGISKFKIIGIVADSDGSYNDSRKSSPGFR